MSPNKFDPQPILIDYTLEEFKEEQYNIFKYWKDARIYTKESQHTIYPQTQPGNIRIKTSGYAKEDYYKNLKALFVYKSNLDFINLDVNLEGSNIKIKNSKADPDEVFEQQLMDAVDDFCLPLIKMVGGEWNGKEYNAGEFWLGAAKDVTKGILGAIAGNANPTEALIRNASKRNLATYQLQTADKLYEEAGGKELRYGGMFPDYSTSVAAAYAGKPQEPQDDPLLGPVFLGIKSFSGIPWNVQDWQSIPNKIPFPKELYKLRVRQKNHVNSFKLGEEEEGKRTTFESVIVPQSVMNLINYEVPDFVNKSLMEAEKKGHNRNKFSLHDIMTASMFEEFNYYAYFTDLANNPITEFEVTDNKNNFPYLFFIDKIDFGALKMGSLMDINYGMYKIKSFMESSSKSNTNLSFNILGDEILTMYRYLSNKVLGQPQGLVGNEDHFNLHIIVPYNWTTETNHEVRTAVIKNTSAYAWHFTLENCKFVGVDKINFDNTPRNNLPIHKVSMVYRECWLNSDEVKAPA